MQLISKQQPAIVLGYLLYYWPEQMKLNIIKLVNVETLVHELNEIGNGSLEKFEELANKLLEQITQASTIQQGIMMQQPFSHEQPVVPSSVLVHIFGSI